MDLARNMGQIPQDGQIASAKSNRLAMQNHRNSLFWKGNSSTIGSYSTPTCDYQRVRMRNEIVMKGQPHLLGGCLPLSGPVSKPQMLLRPNGELSLVMFHYWRGSNCWIVPPWETADCLFSMLVICAGSRWDIIATAIRVTCVVDWSKWLGSKTFQNWMVDIVRQEVSHMYVM